MITQHVSIANSKRRSVRIHIYQQLSVRNMRDIYRNRLTRKNWQQTSLLRYTSFPGGAGQKLNGERVNFQAFPTPFLFRSESPSPRAPFITNYGFGLVIENVMGIPIKYESGNQENWPKRIVFGVSLGFLDRIILAADLTSEKDFHLGLEWMPISAVSLRGGLKYDGLWIWSFGMGANFRNFVFDFAVVPHPYLSSQFRGSLGVRW